MTQPLRRRQYDVGAMPRVEGREMTHKEIAQVLGLTRARIGQIERAALRKLAQALEARKGDVR